MKRIVLIAACLVAVSAAAMKANHSGQASAPLREALTNDSSAGQSIQEAPDCGGEPCDAVIRGLLSFFDRRLHDLSANGRSCADCHMVTDHFQLSPASAEARFRFLQLRRRWDPNADDPLFRPIDADDFRIVEVRRVAEPVDEGRPAFDCRFSHGADAISQASAVQRPHHNG